MITKVILGILPRMIYQEAGEVVYRGRNLSQLSEKQRRELLAHEIAMIPQDPLTAMNPVRKVKDQVLESIRGLRLNRKQAYEYLCGLLLKVRLKDPEKVMNSYPHQLSGGMRQRILITCAFAKKPRLIIADEPTTALDVTVQKEVLRLIQYMQEEYQTAMLFITHDLGVVANIANHVGVLYAGRLLEYGPVERVIEAPSHFYTEALIKASPEFHTREMPEPISQDVLEKLQTSQGEFNPQLEQRI